MNKEDKELLLKDLYSRLPYEPYCEILWKKDKIKGNFSGVIERLSTYTIEELEIIDSSIYKTTIESIKPILRKLDLDNLPFSFTTKECDEFYELVKFDTLEYEIKRLDYLLSHHFDIRGLIDKGLAVEDKNNIYKIE